MGRPPPQPVPKPHRVWHRVGEAETSVKLRFSRYHPVAWLLIPGLHQLREVFPPTTVESGPVRFRRIEPASGGASGAAAAAATGAAGAVGVGVDVGADAALPATAGCSCLPTGEMKPSAPRPARMAPVQLLAEAQSVGPALGAELRQSTTVRRSPGWGQSRPLPCASATSPSLAPSCPRALAPRVGMLIPHRSAAASALACGPEAGSTARRCARRAGSVADASRAVAPAAAALVLCVSAAIPLLRENESRLAPPPTHARASRSRFGFGRT